MVLLQIVVAVPLSYIPHEIKAFQTFTEQPIWSLAVVVVAVSCWPPDMFW
jgi:hypothetical protein